MSKRVPSGIKPIVAKSDCPKFGKKWYKVTDKDGESIYAHGFQYNLPEKGKPGKWHSVKGPLVRCVNGFHVTQVPGEWALDDIHNRIFEVQVAGQARMYNRPDKSVFRHMRLVREIKGAKKERLLLRDIY